MVPAQRAHAVAGSLAWLLLAAPAVAQVQPEARAEVVGAAGTRVEAGAGLTWRAGAYLRAGVNATYDVWRSADTATAAPRAEFVMRFTMDPLAEQPWGVSVGGGLGYRQRTYLMGVVELEGPTRSGVRPAIQLALGGGTRLAVVLRRGVARRR